MVYVMDILFAFIAALLIQVPILFIINWIRGKQLLSHINVIIIVSYLTIVIQLTLWPLVTGLPPVSWSEIPHNLKPFNSIVGSLQHSYYIVGIRNVLGNFLLILPLAVLINIKRSYKAVLTGFFISLSIELLQVLFTKMGYTFSRSFDVDDLILNTLGFYFGYLIRLGLIRVLRTTKKEKIVKLKG